MPRPRVLLAGLLALLLAGLAAAQPDDMARRTQPCTFCHGQQGRAGPDGYYPRLAGKPAGYLYNQLRNFRDGRRHYGLMTRMVDPLSDAYLMEIAQYFSALQVPYPPPAPHPNPPPQAVLARGRQLALEGDAAARLPSCAQCHGTRLTGTLPDVPGLLGLPQDYLTAQLGAWRTGQRRAHAPDCMAGVVRRLNDGDAYAVVSWLAMQPAPADAHPALTREPLPDLPCGPAPGARP